VNIHGESQIDRQSYFSERYDGGLGGIEETGRSRRGSIAPHLRFYLFRPLDPLSLRLDRSGLPLILSESRRDRRHVVEHPRRAC